MEYKVLKTARKIAFRMCAIDHELIVCHQNKETAEKKRKEKKRRRLEAEARTKRTKIEAGKLKDED